MVDYRRGAHTVFEMHLHLVWITKYRRPALSGEVATRVRDLIRDICAQQEVNIMKGRVAKDHVHLFVSIPPQVSAFGEPPNLILTIFQHADAVAQVFQDRLQPTEGP